MTTTVKSTFAAIPNLMNLNMVPFGNAKISGSSVTCQHGPDECLGNSYEQCAIHLYPNATQYFPYYECMEAAGKRMIHGKTSANCAASAGLDNSKIEACVNDATLALQLQEQFGAETGAHNYTPWVLINGKLSPSDGDALLAEVCAAYTGTKPAACTSSKQRSLADW